MAKSFTGPSALELSGGQFSTLSVSILNEMSLAEGQMLVDAKSDERTNLVRVMIDAWREKLVSQVVGIFSTAAEHLAVVRQWNVDFRLGFTEEEFAEAERTVPAIPVGKLVAMVLVPYLDTVQETFDFLWNRAAAAQKANRRWADMKSDAKYLRLIAGAKHPGRCLRWEVIDLGANQGRSPKSVRNASSPHAAIMAALALHPKWVRAMDGNKVPYVWLSGYECSCPDVQSWGNVPYAYFNASDSKVRLSANDCGDVYSDCAVPMAV
jgi:hypothetical protein